MSDLWVITTYYNPCRYVTRLANYHRFIDGLKAVNVPYLTVECAFNDEGFELEESLNVLRIRTGSVLWQKERLLNLAAAALPPSCKYVAWLDCDIIFKNPNWVDETCKALQEHVIVQPWQTCDRLDRNGQSTGDISTSFAEIAPKHRETVSCGRYDKHGHTGYAWAMRREIFDKVGLYELAISGSADHFMAHAIYNEYGFCVENALKYDTMQLSHLYEWGRSFYSLVQGRLGVVAGEIDHLWHGDLKDRRYFLRMHEITDLGYNPYTDVISSFGAPLAWSAATKDKQELKQYFINYFKSRNEDG